MSKLGLGLGSALALTISFGTGEAFAFVAKPLGARCGPDLGHAGRDVRPDLPGRRALHPGPALRVRAEWSALLRTVARRTGPGVGVVVPGTGVGIGVGPGGPGVVVAPRRNCRTTTIRRDDGSVRRIQRCD